MKSIKLLLVLLGLIAPLLVLGSGCGPNDDDRGEPPLVND